MNDLLTLPAISDAPGAAVANLRQRCRGLGLVTWRCDRTGMIVEEPMETGPAGLLLGARPITRLVAGAARAWGALPDDKSPDVTELFPGCWAIPLLETRRRVRTGMLVALAFSQEALSEEVFLAACQAAQLDVQATRRTLGPRARYTRDSTRTTRTCCCSWRPTWPASRTTT